MFDGRLLFKAFFSVPETSGRNKDLKDFRHLLCRSSAQSWF